MDANKLEALKAIGYSIPHTCGFCKHANFSGPGNPGGIRLGWGTCSMYKYKHLKHTGEERQLSITATGTCDHHWELNEDAAEDLGGFREFLHD